MNWKPLGWAFCAIAVVLFFVHLEGGNGFTPYEKNMLGIVLPLLLIGIGLTLVWSRGTCSKTAPTTHDSMIDPPSDTDATDVQVIHPQRRQR